jgi:hypothetical protein
MSAIAQADRMRSHQEYLLSESVKRVKEEHAPAIVAANVVRLILNQR